MNKYCINNDITTAQLTKYIEYLYMFLIRLTCLAIVEMIIPRYVKPLH